mgnify:CR=1 FL=1
MAARAEKRRSAAAEVAAVNARQAARQTAETGQREAAECERERRRVEAEEARRKAATQRAAERGEVRRRSGGKADRATREAAESERERRRVEAEGARLKAAMHRAGKAAKKAAGGDRNESEAAAAAAAAVAAAAAAAAEEPAEEAEQARQGGGAPVGLEDAAPGGYAASGGYATLAGEVRHEAVVVKSRFVAYAAPVVDAEQAIAWVKGRSDAKARHNCFAWRLPGGETRTNGDGEPGGTAGPPILAAIEGAGLHGVAVLVCRYRMDGGAKLGTGGLVRAYGGAAASSLLTAEMVEVVPLLALRVRYPPEDVGVVYAALSAYSPRAAEALEGDAAAGAGLLEAMCEVPREAVDVLARTLRDATSGRAELVAASEAAPTWAPRTFTL